MAEQEGQDEGLDVASVHIRVTHDDDFVVAEFGQIEGPLVFFSPYRDTQGGVDVFDLLVVEDLVLHGLFHVEDLASKWHDGLEHAVAALLGCATCRIALDKKQLAKGRIFFSTVRQFSGEPASAHDGFALDHLPGLPCRVACLRGEDDLLYDGLGVVGVLFQVGFEHVTHRLAHRGAHFGVAEFGLGLALELRLSHFHTHHCSQAFSKVVSADVELQLVQHAAAVSVLFQRVGQPATEPRQVGSPFVGVDVVDVREQVLGERIVVSHGDLDRHPVAFTADVDDVLDDGFAVAVEVGHEIFQPFGAVKGFGEVVALVVLHALVGQGDRDALVEVRQLAHAVGQGVVIVDEGLEDFFVRLEFHGGASLLRRADFTDRVKLFASGVFLFVNLAFPVNLGTQGDGQCVHTRHADPVQTT